MPWPNSSIPPSIDQRFFFKHGDRAYWYKGQLCNCGTNYGSPSDVARATTVCKVCDGLGRFYPSAPILVRGAVSNAMQDREILATGMPVTSEDLIWSADPYSQGPISPFDMLILITGPHAFSYEGQVVTRGTGTTDTLWYRVNVLPSDGVYQTDPTTGVITEYTGATASGKVIDWSSAPSGPVAGTAYSVRYRAQYEWVAFAPPLTRFENTQSLGQKVVLRKRQLVLNNLPAFTQA